MCRWTLEQASPQPRNNSPQAQAWTYSFDTPAGGVNQLQALAMQARIATTYSGSLSVHLATGANLSLPVSGSYQGITYSPIVRSFCGSGCRV